MQSGGTVKFKGPSFDICNSTDYRITINLNGSTIDARACEAAFTIRKGVYGGTISFTNGTILGDGFYRLKSSEDLTTTEYARLIQILINNIIQDGLDNEINVDNVGE